MANYAGEIRLSERQMEIQNQSWSLLYFRSLQEKAEREYSQDPAQKAKILDILRVAASKLKSQPISPIKLTSFKFDGIVGYGSFGKVWKVSHEALGKMALKQLPPNLDNATEIWKERDMLILLKNKRICDVRAVFFDQDVFFALELCHGSVAFLNSRISFKNAVRFSVQLLDGIEWIQQKGVVHADIKPDNCLINTNNNLVISDFGSAFLLKGDSMTLTQLTGSLGYLDYRATKDLAYSKRTDLFGAACVIYEMERKSYFLRYSDGVSHAKYVYVDAFENGRCIGVTTDMPLHNATLRETLVERAALSKFNHVLVQLIGEGTGQHTAGRISQSAALFQLMSEVEIAPWGIDDEKNMVSKDFNNHYEDFELYEKCSTVGQQLVFGCMEYVDFEKVTLYAK